MKCATCPREYDPLREFRDAEQVSADMVRVAVGGSIKRSERCQRCGDGPIFRVSDPSNAEATVIGKFCGNFMCPLWCIEREAP